MAAKLVALEEEVDDGCSPLSEDLALSGKIVMIVRGGCLFVKKVRSKSLFLAVQYAILPCVCVCVCQVRMAQTAGATGVIIAGQCACVCVCVCCV